jgi:hypothetical protein
MVVDESNPPRLALTGSNPGTRWRLGCCPAVTPALEVVRSWISHPGEESSVPMNSESGRGDWIRTSDPLRPSATSCNHPRFSATTKLQVVDSESDLMFRPPVLSFTFSGIISVLTLNDRRFRGQRGL